MGGPGGLGDKATGTTTKDLKSGKKFGAPAVRAASPTDQRKGRPMTTTSVTQEPIDATTMAIGIATAAVLYGYTAEQMAWCLEPPVDGECGWLAGCHDPSDPDSSRGWCTRHEAYMRAHTPQAVA